MGCLLALHPATARADMLSGGLLGSLFRGEDFTGPRLIDLAVLGLVIFALLRLLAGRSKTPDQEQPQPPQRYEPDPDEPAVPPFPPTDKPTMYTNAQAAWEALKSRPADPRAAAGPAVSAGASPDDEFLAGAKLAYGRITASLAARDFADLVPFTTPDFLAQLKNSLPGHPADHPDILLVEATLAGRREEHGHTIMDVDYKVLVHEPEAPHNTDRLERWRFTRDNTTPGANWLLDGMDRR